MKGRPVSKQKPWLCLFDLLFYLKYGESVILRNAGEFTSQKTDLVVLIYVRHIFLMLVL
jgi:hypothetical protein